MDFQTFVTVDAAGQITLRCPECGAVLPLGCPFCPRPNCGWPHSSR